MKYFFHSIKKYILSFFGKFQVEKNLFVTCFFLYFTIFSNLYILFIYADITLKLKYRRYMAEILTIGRKTLSNQSINQSINQKWTQTCRGQLGKVKTWPFMEALSKGSGYVWATDEIRLLIVLLYPNQDELISTYNGIYFSVGGQYNNLANQIHTQFSSWAQDAKLHFKEITK